MQCDTDRSQQHHLQTSPECESYPTPVNDLSRQRRGWCTGARRDTPSPSSIERFLFERFLDPSDRRATTERWKTGRRCLSLDTWSGSNFGGRVSRNPELNRSRPEPRGAMSRRVAASPRLASRLDVVLDHPSTKLTIPAHTGQRLALRAALHSHRGQDQGQLCYCNPPPLFPLYTRRSDRKQGFDEFMNLVIDDAIEVKQITKTNDKETRRPLGAYPTRHTTGMALWRKCFC